MIDNLTERVETDILVVGSEGAGARAAIEADANGKRVILSTKGIFGGSGVTLMAPFSCCAAFGHEDPRDNPEVHFEDTVTGGKFLNNQELVEIFAKESPGYILDLQSYGARFEKRENGKFVQAPMPGHRYPRAVYYNFSTGLQFRKGLRQEVRRRSIRVWEDFFVIDVLVSDGSVAGALGLDIRTGKFVVIECKSLILATGGNLELYYPHNDGSCDVTGDGSAVALRAGAELVDMEFQQFFPTGLVWPPALIGVIWIGDLRYRLGGHLYNKWGDRFMRRYDPERMELSTRDITARAIVSEILDGRGSPHGGAYLDVSYLGKNIIENYVAEVFPNFSFRGYSLLEAGLDIRKDAMEVAPMAHFTMGGIRINTKCGTNIAGLYAAGEVAGGVHGANRCEGNALPETQTFGAIAGREASIHVETAKNLKPAESLVAEAMKKVAAITTREEGIQHFEIRRRVQETMWKQVGVVRTGSGLAAAVKEFDRIKHEDLPRLTVKHTGHRYNRELFEALETINMVEVGEVMARSAALRKESRGAHYLRDLPERDDENWLVNAIAKQKAGEVVIRHEPVVITKLRPRGGKTKWVDQDE